MAKLTFKGSEEYTLMLSKLAQGADGIAKRAIYRGAMVASEAIKEEIQRIPVDKNRKLKKGEKLNSVTKTQKQALMKGYGLTQMKRDEHGDWNTKAGFEGYAESPPTKKYPRGLPIPMLARSVEAGTTVRKKYPFMRKAVTAARPKVIRTMDESINQDCKNVMKK